LLSLTPAELVGYQQTITSRIRILCYFVAGNERVKKPPTWVFTIIYTVFALVVVATWRLYPPLLQGRSESSPRSASHSDA
jgi:hypothetical protein